VRGGCRQYRRGRGLAGSQHGFCPTWWLLVQLYLGPEEGPHVTLAPLSVALLVRVSPAISYQNYISQMYGSQPYLGGR